MQITKTCLCMIRYILTPYNNSYCVATGYWYFVVKIILITMGAFTSYILEHLSHHA